MLIIDCFNHNIYVGDQLVGYIGENELIINKKKFADITDDGVFSIDGVEVGYIDDDGTIYIHGKDAGYIDAGNNFVLRGKI